MERLIVNESKSNRSLPTIDDVSAQRFADAWIESWNQRDVESILKLFHEDVNFASLTAQDICRAPARKSPNDPRCRSI